MRADVYICYSPKQMKWLCDLCAEYLKANSSTISCYSRGKRKMTKELKERDLKYID